MNDVCSKLINIWGLAVSAVLALFLLALFIGYERVWTLLQSMNEGTGAMLGALLGLLAILAGAMINAQLNRQRDNEIREIERRTLASGLKGELLFIYGTTTSHLKSLEARLEKIKASSYNSETKFSLDHFPHFRCTYYKENAGRIGLLGPEASAALTMLYEWIQTFSEEETFEGNFDAHFKTIKASKFFLSTITDTMETTIGKLEDIENGKLMPRESAEDIISQNKNNQNNPR